MRIRTILLAASLLAGCATLEPSYKQPTPPLRESWPQAAADGSLTQQAMLPAWREFYADPKLQQLLEIGLRENRDLRIAALNIDKARALYRIQRSELLPSIDGVAEGNIQRGVNSTTGGVGTTRQYAVSAGVTAYEFDLFGRVQSLSRAALQRYLGTESARDSVQISLLAEIASAYLQLAADQESLQLANDTFAAQERSLNLTQKRYEAGAASKLDVRREQTTVETARADIASYKIRSAQDRNALDLLVGAPVLEALLPGRISEVQFGANVLPPGLPAEVLLTRPDIRAAERDLRAANADIGAARAAFFPRISITGAYGQADPRFENLFSGAQKAWNFAPAVSIPIFDAGARRADLGAAKADQKIAVARYEQSIQAAFRDVADALAEHASIGERVAANQALEEAASDVFKMSDARYRQGTDNYLSLLDAQRELYASRQAYLSARLAQTLNTVTLYKALGGGGAADKL